MTHENAIWLLLNVGLPGVFIYAFLALVTRGAEAPSQVPPAPKTQIELDPIDKCW
jgi:hypothetical protein